MFDINNIERNPLTGQFICSCNVGSYSIAQDIQAHYLMSVRERFGFTTEIGINESLVTIASNNPDITKWIAYQINNGYIKPPLDVFIFYGSRKGLESRWCVGFDSQDASNLIDQLNTQGPFVQADKDSKLWNDKNGKSYSVVMLTGIMEQKPTNESIGLLKKRVELCLNAIHNTTARRLNYTTIQ